MADAGPRAAPPRSRWSGWRFEGWAGLELFALCGFVAAGPLLTVLGDNPDFFIFHRVGGAEVLALVAVLVLAPPAALWGLGMALGLVAGVPVRAVAHAVTVGGLLVLFAVQLGKHLTSVRGLGLIVLAVAAAAVMILGYLRFRPTASVLRVAGVGPLVFAVLFTFASPSSAVVFAGGSQQPLGEVRAIGPHPPVVMVILDEFPLVSLLDADGGIDAARFPHFARFASESTWYRNATAMAGWTPYALPAMLSGREPAAHVAPHYTQHPENLFTLFGEVYQIHAAETISELCPPWYCGDLVPRAGGGLSEVLNESADLWWRTVSPQDAARDPHADFVEETIAQRLGTGAAAAEAGPEFRFERVADNQPARFQDFLTALAAAPPSGAISAAGTDGGPGVAGSAADPLVPVAQAISEPPSLHFLHLLLPHTPWTYLPSGVRYFNVPGLPVDGQWWGRLAVQRLELQLQYTDWLLGEALRVLEETGRYRDALVVVTADHGVSLTPGTAGRELDPDAHAATELAWVPLFIKEPGQQTGAVDDRNWQHVDLLPTVAELAGFAVPWHTDGISAGHERRTGTEKVYFGDLDDRRLLDGEAHFARLLSDPTGIPAVPQAPLPELVGQPVAALPITEGEVRARVDHVERFDEVTLELLPALVHGTLSGQVAADTALAIVVNGRIGAVAPVVAEAGGERRFAGLVADESLFVSGANTLELFLVTDDGAALQRVVVS